VFFGKVIHLQVPRTFIFLKVLVNTNMTTFDEKGFLTQPLRVLYESTDVILNKIIFSFTFRCDGEDVPDHSTRWWEVLLVIVNIEL